MKAPCVASFTVVRYLVPGAFGVTEFTSEAEAREVARRLARVRDGVGVYRVVGEPRIGLWREVTLLATIYRDGAGDKLR